MGIGGGTPETQSHQGLQRGPDQAGGAGSHSPAVAEGQEATSAGLEKRLHICQEAGWARGRLCLRCRSSSIDLVTTLAGKPSVAPRCLQD